MVSYGFLWFSLVHMVVGNFWSWELPNEPITVFRVLVAKWRLKIKIEKAGT